jgi:hypothetical protein
MWPKKEWIKSDYLPIILTQTINYRRGYNNDYLSSNKKLHSIFRGWGRESERLAVCCDDRERENILTLGRPQQHAASRASLSLASAVSLCFFHIWTI